MSKKEERMWSEESQPEEEILDELLQEVFVKEVLEAKPAKKAAKKQKLVVTSMRAHMFSEPNVHSRGVGAVVRGNMLVNAERLDEQWFYAEIPVVGGSVAGFIEATRVTVM